MRRYAIEAQQDADRTYRMVCSGKDPTGLVAATEVGMAVAAIIESCILPGLVRIGEAEGLPPLPMFELCLVAGRGEPTRATAQFREVLRRELGRSGPVDW